MEEYNQSLKSFIILVYDQCKDLNCSLVNVNKIIDYITSNFTLTSQEALQLKISNLFELLQNQGKFNNDLISEDQFERVLQLWIPLVQYEDNSRLNPNCDKEEDLVSAEGIHKRLSRSLTNLKQQFDDNKCQRLRLCQSWICDNATNDENSCGDFSGHVAVTCSKSGTESPHDDPFTFPINVIRSTPKKSFRSTNLSGLQQPNLRFIKLQHNIEHSYFSDSEALLHGEGSLIDDEDSENVGSNKEIDRSQSRRRRHRKCVAGQWDVEDDDQSDLLSQLKQIKFKNNQLVEINDRLQVQLEAVEENLRTLSSKCWNLEKKTKLFNVISDENKQFILEIDDVRKALEKEIEAKKSLFSEKVMMESELVVSKEHIQSLVEKLSLLDAGLEEKDTMIINLKSMMSQQHEFCEKLQELNLDKDEEIIKGGNTVSELMEMVKIYEAKIQSLVQEKTELELSWKSSEIKDNTGYRVDNIQSNHNQSYQDQGCSAGSGDNLRNMFATNAQFSCVNGGSPWSIKVEMAELLVDSTGDNPFCEKMYLEDDECRSKEDYVDTSFHMLQELLSILSSLRMTLTQYKGQLESTSISIKSNEHFTDEITLSYLSHLDDSVLLLKSSTEKAARCQNQFNETFEFLMKRISNLKNEKKTLLLKNEQLLLQVNQSSVNVDVAEKITFIQEELRKERLLGLKKQKEIQRLTNFRDNSKDVRCNYCGRFTGKFSVSSEMSRQQRATEALNLERDTWNFQQGRINFQRSFSNIERDITYNNRDSWLKNNGVLSRKSSSSVDQLHHQKSQEEENTIINDNELKNDRNYYISTDDLLSTPRYKLSKVHPTGVEIDKIIENSWLNTHCTTEERRASVFAQVSEDKVVDENIDGKVTSPSDFVVDSDNSPGKDKSRARNHSSSCSSSNDTSDANSIDVCLERRKLAQELESRFNRMQSRAFVPSTLTVVDDYKSITPTVNEDEQVRLWRDSAEFTATDTSIADLRNTSRTSVPEECDATENVNIDKPVSSPKTSTSREGNLNNTSTLPSTISLSPNKAALPTISIMEVNTLETYEVFPLDIMDTDLLEDNTSTKTITRTATIESDGNSLQASMNRSRPSSKTNSVVDDDPKLSQRSKQGSRRVRRPYTVTGVGLSNSRMIQSDTSSNFEDHSMLGDVNDIQDSIDVLQNLNNTLTNISTEDLECKFNEVSLFYKSDRPTVVDRANDSNKKCNRALYNVEQEFSVLRHLIKGLTDVVDQPCDFVPRIKASISVLEKCVEYLSSKSESLGAIEQEMKMCSIVDVMNEYNNKLLKQREEHLRELEEMKESNNDMYINGSIDQSRTKRSVFAGKDPKSRFQILAQNTVMKSSIIRQLAGRSGQVPSTPDSVEYTDSHSGSKVPYKRGNSNLMLEGTDLAKKGLEGESTKVRRFFPITDESGESFYQKGLQQGLRMNADQTLLEMRAEQSRFSSNLDSLSNMIEEYDPLQEDLILNSAGVERKLKAIQKNLHIFYINFKVAFLKTAYFVVGFVVIIALLIPWLLTPSNSPSSSFSIPVSRRQRIQSSVDDKSPSSTSSSSPFFSNVNVIRHRPAAV